MLNFLLMSPEIKPKLLMAKQKRKRDHHHNRFISGD
jgi:hypothetical protein